MSNERKAQVVTDANVQGPPELVVEIGSPSTRRRDETVKRTLYEGAGVSEYWVVDPDLDVVRVYRRLDQRFTRPDQLSLEAGDVHRGRDLTSVLQVVRSRACRRDAPRIRHDSHPRKR